MLAPSLKDAYEALADRLPTEPVLNIDETGHNDNGNRMWTWCFRASLFTLFKIDVAEQAIRFVVIDRKVTQGSRSETGQRWLERIWTAMATCAQTGLSVFRFLQESLSAYFNDQPAPRLLPDST